MRKIDIMLPLLWAVLGLSLVGVWTNMAGYCAVLLPVDVLPIEESFSRSTFLFGRLFAGVLILIFARRIPKVPVAFAAVVGFAMCVATGLLALSFHQTLVDPSVLASASAFVASGAYMFLIAALYVFLAQFIETEYVVLGITASLVLETVLSQLFAVFLPAPVQLALLVVAPLLVAACYFLAVRTFRDKDPLFMAPVKAVGFRMASYIASVLVVGTTLVFVRGLSAIGIWGKSRPNYLGVEEFSVLELVLITLFVFMFAYLAFILPRRRLTLFHRCIIGFSIMLTGLLLLALGEPKEAGVVFRSLTTAIELFTHLVLWMTVIECARQTSLPPFRAAALNFPLNGVLSLLWAHFFEGTQAATEELVLVVVYLFLIVVLAVLIGGNQMKTSPAWMQTDEADFLSFFTRKWKLTTREAQVLELLLKGKQRVEIENECGLSEGTVKTHITKLYRKLGVHSKYELAELYEEEKQSLNVRQGAPAGIVGR